jgi:hypothetical protein
MTDMTERTFYQDLDNDAAADWTPVAVTATLTAPGAWRRTCARCTAITCNRISDGAKPTGAASSLRAN